MTDTPPPLALLDVAQMAPGQTPAEALAVSVEMARVAEDNGYRRIWYAEHHNSTVASAATSVLVGHVAGKTSTIRVGAGGVMLPNHSPLAIAEQFGTLASLYPGRIDLGVGRSGAGGENLAYALRLNGTEGERFTQDVLELRAFLGDESAVPGVHAVPGHGTNVPLIILGSSTHGARVAAHLGNAFAFAGHFSPGAMDEAVTLYRDRFRPSPQLLAPYLFVSVNVIAVDDPASIAAQQRRFLRTEIRKVLDRPNLAPVSDSQVDEFIASPRGSQLAGMFEHTIVGTPDAVRQRLQELADRTRADEVVIVPQATDPDDRIRSVQLTGESMAASLASRW